MKMEVVLSSPGRFDDDGTPFKSEEIREWSRVDRLTGMLERARIETGRWRASNDASAHSYGKVHCLDCLYLFLTNKIVFLGYRSKGAQFS